jgi:FK506-binding protein 2
MAIVRGLVLLALFGGVILVDGKVEKEVTELGIGVKFKPERCELKAHKGDLVSVHYRGTLADGTEFGNSYERGQPLDFKLGQGSVIKGWDQGILGMCVGEKRKLKIPAKLAYGDESIALSIPAGAALIFDTELVAVNGRTGPGPDDIVADLLGDFNPEDVEFGDPILPF